MIDFEHIESLCREYENVRSTYDVEFDRRCITVIDDNHWMYDRFSPSEGFQDEFMKYQITQIVTWPYKISDSRTTSYTLLSLYMNDKAEAYLCTYDYHKACDPTGKFSISIGPDRLHLITSDNAALMDVMGQPIALPYLVTDIGEIITSMNGRESYCGISPDHKVEYAPGLDKIMLPICEHVRPHTEFHPDELKWLTFDYKRCKFENVDSTYAFFMNASLDYQAEGW